jgi:hypothetical protein
MRHRMSGRLDRASCRSGGICRQQTPPRLGLPWSGLSRWGDVVIQPEQVVGVVLLFDLGQPLQIVPIGGPDELGGARPEASDALLRQTSCTASTWGLASLSAGFTDGTACQQNR